MLGTHLVVRVHGVHPLAHALGRARRLGRVGGCELGVGRELAPDLVDDARLRGRGEGRGESKVRERVQQASFFFMRGCTWDEDWL